MKTLLNRHSALLMRNGKELKNRVVIPPMASETADSEGAATVRTFEHYANLARARAGLLMVEYSYVHCSGRSEKFQLAADTDNSIPGLTKIRKIIHESGALAGLQLTHSGAKSEKQYSGGVLMAPSSVRVPVKDRELEIPSPMDKKEIVLWKDSFIEAAGRAVKAGFDLVEFHAAHGYGLNQFLSPSTNHRNDEYGGTVKKGSRLLFEIIKSTRLAYPDLLLSVRMPGQDFIEGGLSPEDGIYIAKELEALGVDIIDISSGIGGWKRPRSRTGEGYLIDEASLIQANVRIPVIGVGGIERGETIDRLVSENKIALAAVGRAILKDPLLWGQINLKEFHYASA